MPSGYRHQGVIRRLRERHAISEAAAEEVFGDLMLYLRAGARSEAELVPSPIIDDAWHLFLLYTRDYATFCADHFGRFIDHYPHDPPQDVADSVTVAERRAIGANSRAEHARQVGSERPSDWPYHRAAALPDHLEWSPTLQEATVALVDDFKARKQFLESPLCWLGDRRPDLSDAAYLSLYDFFGGGLRLVASWPGVTDAMRAHALRCLTEQAAAPDSRPEMAGLTT